MALCTTVAPKELPSATVRDTDCLPCFEEPDARVYVMLVHKTLHNVYNSSEQSTTKLENVTRTDLHFVVETFHT